MTLNYGERIPQLEELGYEIVQTSYRSWKIVSPKGDEYIVWADLNKVLHCSCPFYISKTGGRACKHIKYIRHKYGVLK